jgi:transposase
MDKQVCPRKPYPTDVSDDEWVFAAPYLTLMVPEAPQRRYELREVFNALRWIVRAGAPWRLLPTNFPPWEAVYQQARRWLAAGVFETMAHDLRMLLREAFVAGEKPAGGGRDKEPRIDAIPDLVRRRHDDHPGGGLARRG